MNTKASQNLLIMKKITNLIKNIFAEKGLQNEKVIVKNWMMVLLLRRSLY